MAIRVEAASAHDAFEITPSDVTVIAFEALYIGTAGDVTVVTSRGTTVLFQNVPVGILPIRGKQVLSTGTAALDIVGLIY